MDLNFRMNHKTINLYYSTFLPFLEISNNRNNVSDEF